MSSGPSFWMIVLTLGAVALALAIIYGMRRNRERSLSEKAHTEAATRREYEREDQDRS